MSLDSINAQDLKGGALDIAMAINPMVIAPTKGTMAYEIAVNALIKHEAEIYKNSTIYRNGIYTTVKWGDGTVTTVKCKEGDECDDTEAFINALANKVFGGRSALKRHVKEHAVDVAEKKRKKAKKKEKVAETPKESSDKKFYDSKGQELHVGDKVFVEFDDGYFALLLPSTQRKLEQIRGKIVTVSHIMPDGVVSVSYGEEEDFCYTAKSIITKVKTEAPFGEGDYVIVDKPEDTNCSPKWIIEMDELVGKPLKIIDGLLDGEVFGATANGDSSNYWLYRNDWVRKA